MSEPRNNYDNSLLGAKSELMSALSSLHMEATLLPKQERPEDGLDFLDENYVWVKHSKVHIRHANNLIGKGIQEQEEIKRKVFNIYFQAKKEEITFQEALKKVFDMFYS